MSSFALVTPPAVEPVLLADAKQHARIDTTADDALVTGLITAARQWAEQYTGRAFVTQTWQLVLDRWPGAAADPRGDGMRQGPVGVGGNGDRHDGAIRLPCAPLQSVTSVTVYDDSDNPTVWPAANYFVDTVGGRLAPRLGAVWPLPTRTANGIVILYVAGYGADGTYVPAPIVIAIRQLVAHWYEHRGEAATAASARGAVIANAVPVPLVIQALLAPYRIQHA